MSTTAPHFAQARARQALKNAGLPVEEELFRASSTRNEVFVGEQHVVRVNRHPNQRLRREALLCRFLPDAEWAPQVVAYGGELGADYLIVRRLPGAPLGRCWPDMSMGLRRSAIRQLGDAIRQLHTTSTPVRVPRIDNLPYLIDPRCVTPLVPMLMGIDRLRSLGIDKGVLNAAEDLAHATGSAVTDFDQRNLVHGDLTFENLLWDGSVLSGVLDFEWSRGAPIDMELDVLLRMCAFPYAHVAEDYEDRTRVIDYAPIPEWLAESNPEMFAHPRLAERLRLYSMAFDLFDLAADPPEQRVADLAPLHPMKRLMRLVEGDSYLERGLTPLGIKA
jgi:hygromycin-B 7''-O-kinase